MRRSQLSLIVMTVGAMALFSRAEAQQKDEAKQMRKSMQEAIDAASCTGEYADAILALTPYSREFERRPEANYSYCLRNTATYECLYYGKEGKVKKRRIPAVAHGTAFVYRAVKGEYQLLTNDHVATWPPVTFAENQVAGVPAGCKKIDEDLRLVKNESDDYEPDQIQVFKMAGDPALDAAVVKTRHKLNLMPYRIGRSAMLRPGNLVKVRGYPLGLLQATNFGKVVTAYDRDQEKHWDHVDFLTDALLTTGNSGSPVLAISCKTGELELIGMYHAGYRGSPALNAVVAIDELKEFMATFTKSRPAKPSEEGVYGSEVRRDIVKALSDPLAAKVFKLGERFAEARLEDDSTVAYDILDTAFPARTGVGLILRDVEDGSGQGRLESIGVMLGRTIRWVRPEEMDAETLENALHLHDLARRQFARFLAFWKTDSAAEHSPETLKRANNLARKLNEPSADASETLKSLLAALRRLPPAKESSAPPGSGARGCLGNAGCANSVPAEPPGPSPAPVPVSPPQASSGPRR